MKLISYIAYPLVIFPLNVHTLTTTLRGTKGVHHQITRVLLSPSPAPTPRHPNADPSGNRHNAKPTTPNPTRPPIKDADEDFDSEESTSSPSLDSEEPTSSPFCNESIRRHLKSSKGKFSKTEKTKKSKKAKSKSCKSRKISKSAKSSKINTVKHTKAPKSPKALKATKAANNG